MPAGATTDVRTQLERADETLTRLQSAPPTAAVPALFRWLCWTGAALAAAGLVGHTFFEEGGFQVDETSVALLALAVVLPFAPRLRVIEFGGAKAEWQADAADTLADLLAVVAAQHQALTRLYTDAPSADGAEEDLGPSRPAPPPPAAGERRPVGPPAGTGRVLRSVLWVDDTPAGNSYEAQALRALGFEVEQVLSTADAEDRLAAGDVDVVITDVVRVEGGRRDRDAGRAVLEAVRSRGREVPVVVYGSPDGAARHGDALLAAGAAAVTASPSDLLDVVRSLAVDRLHEVVVDRVRRSTGTVRELDPTGHLRTPPLLTAVGGVPTVVAASHWLRRPKAFALDRVVTELATLRAGASADAVWLVAQSPVFSDGQRERAAAQGVVLLALDDLDARLSGAPGPTPGGTAAPGR